MTPILVVGPNPALDLILPVPGFAPGGVFRTRRALHLAGGKPVNVARALRRLGVEVTLASPLGEAAPVREACRDLSIDLHALPISGATRTCVVVADPESGVSTVVNEPGPQLTVEEADAYQRLVMDLLPGAGMVLASGSLPPGLPLDFYRRLIEGSRRLALPLILDTSGEALRQALPAGPWAVKVNAQEIEAVTGTADVLEPAGRLLALGVERVVVTLGAEGAIAVGPEGRWRVSAPPVDTVNAVGAGDAFLAGLAAGLQRGASWPKALRLAAAAGARVASRLTPDLGPNPDLRSLLDAAQIESLVGAEGRSRPQ